MDTDLQARVVVVTGASGGLGGEIVRAFWHEGAKVVAHYGSNAKSAMDLAKELDERCVPVGANLTKETDVAQLFAQAEARFGPVHVLIANAGRWPVEHVPVERMSLERWQTTLGDNLTSVFLCMREFLRGIARHRLADPAAVLISSTAGIIGEAGHADYAAAKASIAYGFALSLKNEIARLAPRGRVNVVCPGWTRTPRVARMADDPAKIRRVLQTIPLRKIGTPSDIASACVFLASSRLAGHITGQTLTVAGGMEGRVLYDPEETGHAQS